LSNLLQSRHLSEDGVLNVVDFFPQPDTVIGSPKNVNHWLVRHVECVRGTVDVHLEMLPAFHYATHEHSVTINSGKNLARFESKDLSLELIAVEDRETNQLATLSTFESEHALGEGVRSCFELEEGQCVTFILRDASDEKDLDRITSDTMFNLMKETEKFWFEWISQSKYQGRWREVVQRSLLILKLLTYAPTGGEFSCVYSSIQLF